MGPQFAGYVFKITGGNDKDGFSMSQGIMKCGRVRILVAKGHKCYRPRRAGERKRKSVRGCIVGKDISVLALTIVKHGEKAIAGITDLKRPRKLGPKRASNIRSLYQLEKKDDVRKYVVKKTRKNGKLKMPKIQRLVTNERIRRKKVIRVSLPLLFLRKLSKTESKPPRRPSPTTRSSLRNAERLRRPLPSLLLKRKQRLPLLQPSNHPL